MIQDIYIRLNNIIKIPFFSLLVAYIFNFLYRIKFILQKVQRKKTIVELDSKTALEKINSIFPKHHKTINVIDPEVSDDIDLSIIVPVYNYEINLEKNIISYISQKTNYNYEIIFVNDGSTDSSQKIIEKYVDNKKIKLINKNNGGASSARNVGINVATGKYIMFVDCDDVLHSDSVEKLLSKAINNDSDIVMCAHNLVKTDKGKIIAKIPYIYPHRNLLGYKNGGIIMNYPGFPWGKIYKRKMFNCIRYPESYWYEDTITLFLLFTQCKSFDYIKEPLYDYYIHESNITKIVSNTNNPKVIDRYWILDEIIESYLNNGNTITPEFYELLLKHTSLFYYSNIKNLDAHVVEAMFVLAKDLCLKYKTKGKIRLSYMLRQVEKSFETNDINLWKLASVYQ